LLWKYERVVVDGGEEEDDDDKKLSKTIAESSLPLVEARRREPTTRKVDKLMLLYFRLCSYR